MIQLNLTAKRVKPINSGVFDGNEPLLRAMGIKERGYKFLDTKLKREK